MKKILYCFGLLIVFALFFLELLPSNNQNKLSCSKQEPIINNKMNLLDIIQKKSIKLKKKSINKIDINNIDKMHDKDIRENPEKTNIQANILNEFENSDSNQLLFLESNEFFKESDHFNYFDLLNSNGTHTGKSKKKRDVDILSDKILVVNSELMQIKQEEVILENNTNINHNLNKEIETVIDKKNIISLDVNIIGINHSNIKKFIKAKFEVKFLVKDKKLENNLKSNNNLNNTQKLLLTNLEFTEYYSYINNTKYSSFLVLHIKKLKEKSKHVDYKNKIEFVFSERIEVDKILESIFGFTNTKLELRMLNDSSEIKKAFKNEPCTDFTFFKAKCKNKSIGQLNFKKITEFYKKSIFFKSQNKIQGSISAVLNKNVIDKSSNFTNTNRTEIIIYDNFDSQNNPIILSIPNVKDTKKIIKIFNNNKISLNTKIKKILLNIFYHGYSDDAYISNKEILINLKRSNNEINFTAKKFENSTICKNFLKNVLRDRDLENYNVVYKYEPVLMEEKLHFMELFLSIFKVNNLFSYKKFQRKIKKNENFDQSFLENIISILPN